MVFGNSIKGAFQSFASSPPAVVATTVTNDIEVDVTPGTFASNPEPTDQLDEAPIEQLPATEVPADVPATEVPVAPANTAVPQKEQPAPTNTHVPPTSEPPTSVPTAAPPPTE
ncbi:MAG: hypothetical protein ABIQ44_01215, partial [Chloroflexia bacterium]